MVILTQVQEESLLSQGLFPLKTGAFLDDGTFSTVIAVSDELVNEKFAVKIVDKMLVMRNDKCKAILEEKKIHLSLNHPNIVKLFSTFQDEQSLYFVLELCDGGNLLKCKALLTNIPNVPDLCKQLICAIQYLHSKNILHRDIKPENILISNGKDLKLADYGSATSLSDVDKSELNKFVGTPEYLAPEILNSSIELDETIFAVDWWAAGCTIYWLLTGGKVLFDAATEYLVYKSIESGPSPASLKECCDLDGTMAEIIFGLLEKDPQKRINFVKEQLKALLC